MTREELFWLTNFVWMMANPGKTMVVVSPSAASAKAAMGKAMSMVILDDTAKAPDDTDR